MVNFITDERRTGGLFFFLCVCVCAWYIVIFIHLQFNDLKCFSLLIIVKLSVPDKEHCLVLSVILPQ